MAVTLSREQRAIAKAELLIGRKLGVGATTWDVERLSQSGVGAATAVSGLVWAGYVVDEADPRAAEAAAGATVAGQQWAAVAPESSIALQGDDVLVSRDRAGLRFVVTGAAVVEGYAKYTLGVR
jgi:hypothetical protein